MQAIGPKPSDVQWARALKVEAGGDDFFQPLAVGAASTTTTARPQDYLSFVRTHREPQLEGKSIVLLPLSCPEGLFSIGLIQAYLTAFFQLPATHRCVSQSPWQQTGGLAVLCTVCSHARTRPPARLCRPPARTPVPPVHTYAGPLVCTKVPGTVSPIRAQAFGAAGSGRRGLCDGVRCQGKPTNLLHHQRRGQDDWVCSLCDFGTFCSVRCLAL